jgi:hypothetical protein
METMKEARRYRDFPGKGWLINGLRALHMVGVVGIGASLVARLPASAWDGYVLLLAASGIAILLLDWWSNPAYLRQVNGISVVAKLALLGWFLLRPEHREPIFWTILLFSVLVSHAPGKLRHRLWWR